MNTAGITREYVATNLIIDLRRSIFQRHRLLEVLADFFQLLRLLPFVERAGHVDLGGRMLPIVREEQVSKALQSLVGTMVAVK